MPRLAGANRVRVRRSQAGHGGRMRRRLALHRTCMRPRARLPLLCPARRPRPCPAAAHGPSPRTGRSPSAGPPAPLRPRAAAGPRRCWPRRPLGRQLRRSRARSAASGARARLPPACCQCPASTASSAYCRCSASTVRSPFICTMCGSGPHSKDMPLCLGGTACVEWALALTSSIFSCDVGSCAYVPSSTRGCVPGSGSARPRMRHQRPPRRAGSRRRWPPR
jgi:hypothetical protein